MVQPRIREVRPVDPLLTNISIGFKNDRFHWDKLAPVTSVPQISSTFTIYDSEYWFRRQSGADRGNAAPYTRVGYGLGKDSYECTEIGFEKALADPVRAASLLPESLDVTDTAFLTNIMQLELDFRVADALFNVTDKWGTNREGVTNANNNTDNEFTQWDDYTNSDPLVDIREGMNHVHEITGANPNTLFLGYQAWESLRRHPKFTDEIKYTNTGVPTGIVNANNVNNLMAEWLGLDSVVVGDTVYTDDPEKFIAAKGVGGGDSDISAVGNRKYIWGKSGLLLVNNAPQLGVAAGAFTFIWDEKGNVPWAIEQYREEQVRSDITRIFTWPAPSIVSKEHGYHFRKILS